MDQQNEIYTPDITIKGKNKERKWLNSKKRWYRDKWRIKKVFSAVIT